MNRMETDVIVIGGGATGARTIRDLALRGVKTILIEKTISHQEQQEETMDCYTQEQGML